MRAKKLFPFAFLALALTACTSDEVTPSNGESAVGFKDGNYVSLAINLPTQTGNDMRAANDNFDDGLESEYEVKDATLILFQGDNEATAKFHSAYNLTTSWTNEADDPNQITVVSQRIVKYTGSSASGSNLYAFVVLNKNKVLNVEGAGLTVNGESFAGTFEELSKEIVTGNVEAFSTTGLLMANAPLANAQGGTSNPTSATFQTLTSLNGSTFSTKEEAESADADKIAQIYVERAVAKVTMQEPAKGYVSAYDNNSVAYTITGWNLDITNNSSYLVHQPSTEWNGYASEYATSTSPYRFVGYAPVKKSVSLYRSYWGTDPNYDGEAYEDGAFSLLSATPDLVATYGNENPKYCMENTFCVKGQAQDETTRIVVGAQIGDGSDFYLVGNDNFTMYDEAGALSYVKQAILNLASVKEAAKEAVATSGTVDLDASSVTPTWSRNAETGVMEVTDFTVSAAITGGETATFTYDADPADLVKVNEDVTVKKYVGGISYYPIRIKHFGDDLTTWSAETASNKDAIYYGDTNTAEENFLGRYGVLRNNWYDVSVTGIRQIGSPVVPNQHYEGEDDEIEQYIAIQINILSWAKRVQSVIL